MKTSLELERTFVQTIRAQTGKSLKQWIQVLDDAEYASRTTVKRALIDTYNLKFLHAAMLTGIYFNNGKPVYQ